MDIYYIFTILPFMVCMIWSVIYLLEYGKASQDKRILTGFAVLSAVLYFTHAVHFSGSGHLSVVDCIWLLCSLSLYKAADEGTCDRVVLRLCAVPSADRLGVGMDRILP